MTTTNDPFAVIQELSGQNNTLTVPRLYIQLTGDHVAALVLNQIVYWTKRKQDNDGWFYKSAKDWEEEVCISHFQLTRAVKLLKGFGVETKLKRANNAPTLHYRINTELFLSSIYKFLENRETRKSRNSNMDYEETYKSDIQETSKSLTKTTTKTTTKITSPSPAREGVGHSSQLSIPTSRTFLPVEKSSGDSAPCAPPSEGEKLHNPDDRLTEVKKQWTRLIGGSPPSDNWLSIRMTKGLKALVVAMMIANSKENLRKDFIHGVWNNLTEEELEKYDDNGNRVITRTVGTAQAGSGRSQVAGTRPQYRGAAAGGSPFGPKYIGTRPGNKDCTNYNDW